MLPSDEDHARRQRRQSWWLLVARLSSGRTQQDAASALGFTASSSYGDFERGVTPASYRQLVTLAVLFDVDIALLADPPETDEERLEERTGRPSVRTGLLSEQPAPKRRRAVG